MFESAEHVPSAPLAAISARRYNSRVPAKDTNAMRLDTHFFGRWEGAIGHDQERVKSEDDSRDLSALIPTDVMQAGCESIDAGAIDCVTTQTVKPAS